MSMSAESAAQQGALETKPAPAGMRHLGVITENNESVMMVAGDARVAERWRGRENGEDDSSGKGSDWELCYRALTDGDGTAVTFDGGVLTAVQIEDGGLVDVYLAGDSLVLVEVSYTMDGLSVSADPGFLEYVASPFSGQMFGNGSFVVSSGAVAILPAGLPGDGATTVLPGAGPADVAKLPLGEPSTFGRGLAVRLPAGNYRVRVDESVERAWGGARRALVEPCQDSAP
jgi:hypothetical protein